MPGTLLLRRSLALVALGTLVACSDAEPLGSARLLALSIDDVSLTPRFSSGVTSYGAETSLLAHRVRLRGTTLGAHDELRVHDRRGERVGVEQSADGSFTAWATLALGDNELELCVGTTVYAVRVTRHPEPWRDVQVLGLSPPLEDAYFGDYLRASERFLYVNASRRGRLYRKQAGRWAFERPSEELVPQPLEWMFEAALTDDALAFVAQPAGGTETVFAFSVAADGSFVPGGEHETDDQGTLRLWGDELVFASSEKLELLRREGGAWSLAQTLRAPAPDVGFALRPTYFDAPGVALADGVLVVGTPLASSPTSPGAAPSALSCGDAAACAVESGAVLVYERDAGGSYGAPAVLKPPAPVADLRFGHATALDGDLLAVGVPREGSVAPESGAVFLFRRDARGWVPAGSVKPSVARAYDYFGDELVLAGDVLLVGAPGQDSAFGMPPTDESAPDSGGVFVFVRDGDSFRELGLWKLPPELAPPFPFPQALQRAGSTLVAASNTAPGELPDGEVAENAGRVFHLSW